MAETDLSEVVIGDEPLTSSNYENWKVYMQNYLSNLNLWGIVNGTESEPVEVNTQMIKNEMALNAIKTSCSPEMVPHLHGINSAKEAWDRLLSMQSSEVNVASSTEETVVVVEIQRSDEAVPGTQVITHKRSLKRGVFSKPKSRFGEQMSPLALSDEDRQDAVPEMEVITHGRSLKRGVFSEPKSRFGEQMSPLALSDEDRPDAVPEMEGGVFSKPKSRFGEQMSPLALSDEDRPDAVPEMEESFADAWERFQQTLRNAASGWSDDKPDYIRFRPLYKALLEGDWERAKNILEDHPEGLNAKITSRGETALHAAVASGKLSTVKELLKLLPPVALESKTWSGDAAISYSALDGTTEIATLMVEKNDSVLRITNRLGVIPLVMSIHYQKEHMFRYLYSVTPKEELDPDKSKNGASFLNGAIIAGRLDVALEVLELYPKLAISKDMFGCPAIIVLAQNSYMFPSGSRFGFWQRGMYSSCLSVVPGVKDLQMKKRKHVQVLQLLKVICSAISHLTDKELKDGNVYDAMFLSAKKGNIEVFMELFDANPSLLYATFAKKRTLYHQAVISRQENIFNFISSMRQRDLRATHKDLSLNNLLHYAGMLPLSSQLDKISGAALQMQREIQWFQEVEKIVQPKYKEHINKDGKTPAEVFTEEHKALKKDGEAWMKETANACMLVSALIATVVFAAAFTVPGGNDQSTGTPLFLKTPAFTFFIVSDAISLFASCTSILMFFSILTARYAEQDFLRSLPQRLIIGLASLFISIAAMMAAFGATLVIVLHSRVTWAFIPVTLLASVPVVLFGLLQFPLFVDIVRSTYGTGIFTWQKVYLNNNE